MNRSYKKQEWTNVEREKLIALTEQYRLNSEYIDWAKIASQMENRTDSQCKSYYANIIKPSLNVQIRENHTWTRKELLSLWVMCVNYNADFAIIKKPGTIKQPVFENISIKQMQCQWHQLVQKQKLFYSIYKQIEENEAHIQTLNKKVFVSTSFILRLAVNRKKLMNQVFSVFQQQTEKVDDKGYPLDFMEIKALEKFFLDVDLNKVRQCYIKEHERRGIPDIGEPIK
ncbi:Myb-like_DNA-binding domain-containing protein [Hexamita inflata]|uniref:Myb-like_DNA-binding domain-containing protein n=1 Tax=Hexamita inflata TaxID=28002 RepID=A0ABP1H6R0_9EUKA